jgi:trimethylamine:corrinoid methyltransferase-like protein
MNHILAAVTAMELVPFVGDILGAKAFSPRVLVYADDVIHEARRLAAGFEIDEESIGLDDIAEIGPGGTFLESERTFELFRDAYRQSEVLPLLTMEAWQERGAPEAEDVLKRYTRQLVAALEPPDGFEDLVARGEAFIRGLDLS